VGLAKTVRLQREPFALAAEADALAKSAPNIGAVVTFSGICRGEEDGAPIKSLTLEHYPGMAEVEIERHLDEAAKRWPLLGATVIHRYGRIEPGEGIVLVVTASRHRDAAFAAAEFLMDYLKSRAPFWKEVESASGKAWIAARDVDETAVARWSEPQSGDPAGTGRNK
jgi:molybdopterin synthase catalytic subunit